MPWQVSFISSQLEFLFHNICVFNLEGERLFTDCLSSYKIATNAMTGGLKKFCHSFERLRFFTSRIDGLIILDLAPQKFPKLVYLQSFDLQKESFFFFYLATICLYMSRYLTFYPLFSDIIEFGLSNFTIIIFWFQNLAGMRVWFVWTEHSSRPQAAGRIALMVTPNIGHGRVTHREAVLFTNLEVTTTW